jgi:hypothetical protein
MFPAKLAKQAEPKPVKEGVYDFRWGSRDMRLIVTSRISKEKRNALWLMFSAIHPAFFHKHLPFQNNNNLNFQRQELRKSAPHKLRSAKLQHTTESIYPNY